MKKIGISDVHLQCVGLGVLAFGAFFTFKTIGNKIKKSKQEEKRKGNDKKMDGQEGQKTEYGSFYFDKNSELSRIESQLINSPSVEGIYLESANLGRDEFLTYTREIRKRRRLIRKINENQYINMILNYEAEISDLLVRDRLEIISAINLDLEQFEMMEANYQTFDDLRALNKKTELSLRESLKKFKSPKPMSKEILISMMDEESGFIKNTMYDRLRKKMQEEQCMSQSDILKVVSALLEDIIFEKYGYEKEDIESKIEQFDELKRYRKSYIQKMEADIGQYNFDSQESLKGERDEQQIDKSIPTIEKTLSDGENSFSA